MGRLLQLLHKVGRNSKYPEDASLGPPPLCQQPATASGGVGHHGQYSFGQGVCTTVYDSATDTACHTEHDQACHTEHDQVCNTITEQACHTEFDTIVDTTHIEECQDIVTEQCHQVSQQVHHSSGVVGHNTQVVPGGVVAGYSHVKREAAGGYGGLCPCSQAGVPPCPQAGLCPRPPPGLSSCGGEGSPPGLPCLPSGGSSSDPCWPPCCTCWTCCCYSCCGCTCCCWTCSCWSCRTCWWCWTSWCLLNFSFLVFVEKILMIFQKKK